MTTLRTARIRAMLNALVTSTHRASTEIQLVSAMHEQIDALEADIKRELFEAKREEQSDAERALSEEAKDWPDLASLLAPAPAQHEAPIRPSMKSELISAMHDQIDALVDEAIDTPVPIDRRRDD